MSADGCQTRNEEIARRLENGESGANLAREFGVTRGTIYQIRDKVERRRKRANEQGAYLKDHQVGPSSLVKYLPLSTRLKNCILNDAGEDAKLSDAIRMFDDFATALETPNLGRKSLHEFWAFVEASGLPDRPKNTAEKPDRAEWHEAAEFDNESGRRAVEIVREWRKQDATLPALARLIRDALEK